MTKGSTPAVGYNATSAPPSERLRSAMSSYLDELSDIEFFAENKFVGFLVEGRKLALF